MITQERLRELFDYCDGGLIRRKTGTPAIAKPSKHHRYLRVTVDSKAVAVHRIIFLWHHGFLPKVIDHIDGNRLNNRIENLRSVTQQENCLNKRHHSTSKSPYKNVYRQATNKSNPNWKCKWVVSLTVHGKRTYLGSFEDIEFADLVATEARALYHGAYARHH